MIAAGSGFVAGVTSICPSIAAVFSMNSGYWTLLGLRVNANNKENGVYVAVTWLAVFNIEPL